ncbi:hypothetical protein ACFVZD_45370 [Streptomyces sp. NPDC058287]|uniref:hypothetical protein n=1 Tax=unclassified Streptomyces TaxID=2593676 RepID=UPI0036F04AD0
MPDRWDVPPMGPGTAPEKWLLRVGVVGLFIAAPGVAVGYFEGFQDGTEAGAFAWVMMFFGGLLTSVTAWVGLIRRLDPGARRERRRRTAAGRSRQAPLAAAELTHEALLEAAVHSTPKVVQPQPQPQPQPPAPVTDGRRRLVWWRNRDLLNAIGLPGIAAWTVGMALVGLGGVLHIFGGAGRGWFFLVGSACGLVAFLFEARLARVAVSEDVRPMRWLLLCEPDAGEAYLVLYRADGDPDEDPPMLLRLATKRQARRLPSAGVADVHGLLRPVTVLVPWIDGSPVWTRHPVTALDLTTERDRGRLTYLKGSEPHGQGTAP